SKDHPVLWMPENPGLSPWVDDRMLQRDGWIGVCSLVATMCVESMQRAAGGGPFIRTEYEFSASFLGRTGRPMRFVFFIVPPEQSETCMLSSTGRNVAQGTSVASEQSKTEQPQSYTVSRFGRIALTRAIRPAPCRTRPAPQ